ncbi:tetratricopeptide repeat protein [Maridesulfovibrio zosterae]|uniref:tetratricopeptide repeat protein n=1 Tax=Maridesulfovibrio zosterae TaxID=82171 RepID=UPI000403CADB|nr:hypothetical protein [Maridesulfovibrio zosterae]
MPYSRICFVVMPFGEKEVDGKLIDFEAIYSDIFLPAIQAVELPEGGRLAPRRADTDFFAGIISQGMFEYIEYSRLVFTDLTGLNPNVLYELGHRHRARQAGTVIFRQSESPIPFDLNQVRFFPYEFEPAEQAEESRKLITKVISETLKRNRLDSPIQQILQLQEDGDRSTDELRRKAEEALLNQDPHTAVTHLKEAVSVSPQNAKLQLELGLMYRELSQWEDALNCFKKSTEACGGYSEAWRERGIAENKLFCKNESEDLTVSGESSLRHALKLDPMDFDALSSLGGVLKRANQLEEAFQCYFDAAEISNGNSYPLLNALKIKGKLLGAMALSPKDKFLLQRANKSLSVQVSNDQPYNVPWSFFDLAEVCCFLGDKEGALKAVDDGFLVAEGWQVKTFFESLSLLSGIAGEFEVFPELLERVEGSMEFFAI